MADKTVLLIKGHFNLGSFQYETVFITWIYIIRIKRSSYPYNGMLYL